MITGGISDAIVGLLVCVEERRGARCTVEEESGRSVHYLACRFSASVAQKLTRGEDSNSQITDGYRFIAST